MAAVELSQALRQELDWPHSVTHHPKSARFGAPGLVKYITINVISKYSGLTPNYNFKK